MALNENSDLGLGLPRGNATYEPFQFFGIGVEPVGVQAEKRQQRRLTLPAITNPERGHRHRVGPPQPGAARGPTRPARAACAKLIFKRSKDVAASSAYVANAGRFNVESYLGWSYLESLIKSPDAVVPELSHVQVQTLLGAIGATKGFDIWIPPNDRIRLDWSLTAAFRLSDAVPPALLPIKEIAQGIDVIWVARGGDRPGALYEVEHSTPIYSGLLRFNDVHLMLPNLSLRFGIVSNDDRRALFVRQLSRPTFKASGLNELCTFLEYRNVFGWHAKLLTGDQRDA